jgi:hypothetical protein
VVCVGGGGGGGPPPGGGVEMKEYPCPDNYKYFLLSGGMPPPIYSVIKLYNRSIKGILIGFQVVSLHSFEPF